MLECAAMQHRGVILVVLVGAAIAYESTPMAETAARPISNAPLQSSPPSKQLFSGLFSKAAGTSAHSSRSVAEIMHEKFEAEPVDPSWSANIEANAKDFFDKQPSSQTSDTVSIECRSTICEILAVAKSRAMSAQASEQLQKTIYTSPRQSWWTAYGLVDIVTAMTLSDDGLTLVATYFTKNPVKSLPPIQY